MIAFLIDADNFSAPAWVDEAFQAIERTEGAIAIRRAYGSAENLKGLADTLETLGSASICQSATGQKYHRYVTGG